MMMMMVFYVKKKPSHQILACEQVKHCEREHVLIPYVLYMRIAGDAQTTTTKKTCLPMKFDRTRPFILM